MVNKALLRDVMDHIETLYETNPVTYVGGSGDHWLQHTWHTKVYDTKGEACGTAACFAGWTLLRLGYAVRGTWCRSPEGKVNVVPHSAAAELGLDWVSANRLFDGDNTIKDLRKIVNEYCE